jgi:hypothetical protein
MRKISSQGGWRPREGSLHQTSRDTRGSIIEERDYREEIRVIRPSPGSQRFSLVMVRRPATSAVGRPTKGVAIAARRD